jgi:hypothetical protein
MSRKVLLSLGLWLLLLVGQQGAVLHELGHVCRAAAHTEIALHADAAADETCELCLGYSQLATPASHSVPVFLLERVASRIGTERSLAATPVDLPTPRSRGPPASTLNS